MRPSDLADALYSASLAGAEGIQPTVICWPEFRVFWESNEGVGISLVDDTLRAVLLGEPGMGTDLLATTTGEGQLLKKLAQVAQEAAR